MDRCPFRPISGVRVTNVMPIVESRPEAKLDIIHMEGKEGGSKIGKFQNN